MSSLSADDGLSVEDSEVVAWRPSAFGVGRRERGKFERRERIRQAAREVFREKGYVAATTREIAERADVGKGTLFTYAADKRELLMMVFNEELDAVTAAAFAAVPKGAPLLTQLMTFFEPRYEFWGRDPALSRHVVHEIFAYRALPPSSESNPESGCFHARQARIIAKIADIVGEQQRAGAITKRERAELIAELIWDIYLSENRNWLANEEPKVAEGIDHARRVLSLAIDGLKV